jgi:DNA polymerase-1
VFVFDDYAARKKVIFPDYKANRLRSNEQNDSLKCQKNTIKELLNILDIQHVQIQGEEADDVIASLAILARKKGQKVVIYSQDHDFEQIISNNISLKFESGKLRIVKDMKWVTNEYGVHPTVLGECMQLTGDMGDNVPGVEKVGLKTAINLIKANGSLRKLLRDGANAKMYSRKGELTKITQKLATNIEKAHEQILLNKELVVLNTTIPVSEDLFKTTMEPNFKQFVKLVDHYQIDKKKLNLWIDLFNYGRQLI